MSEQAGFIRLVEVLDIYKPKTLAHFIYTRGIETLDVHSGERKIHNLDDTGLLDDPELKMFINTEEILQAMTIVANWPLDGFITPSAEDEYKGFEEIFNFGWFLNKEELDELEEQLFPRLVTLSALLDSENPPHPGMLVEEIMINGCYRYTQFPNYLSIDATSVWTAHALAAIGMHVKYSGNYEYWEWLDQDNPLYDFGWPKDKLPKFRWSDAGGYPDMSVLEDVESLASMYKDGLNTVAKILWMGEATPASINKALLEHGVWKITPLGSSVYMKPDEFVEAHLIETEFTSDDLQRSLIEYAKPMLSGKKPSIDLLQTNNGALTKYGWPYEHLPNFKNYIKDLHPKPTKNLNANEVTDTENAFSKDSKANVPFTPGLKLETDALSPRNQKGWELLVMALLAFVRGEVVISTQDPYKSLTDLQKDISKNFDNLSGLGQTSVDLKFGLANAHRVRAGLPSIKETAVNYHLKVNHEVGSNKK